MKEEENIGGYLLRVYEVVNTIKVLGGELKEREVVDKVIRTLAMKYVLIFSYSRLDSIVFNSKS